MRTTKPFSTISYNTADFLKLKLGDLVQRRIINYYCFVEHYAEEEETKSHKHLFIMPNGQINTDTLTDILQEIDSTNPLKPLGVMPWQSSKWADWYLYSSHDVAYLVSKGQSRKYHYTKEDFITSDNDFFIELIHTIDRTKYAKTQEFVQQVCEGKSFYHMVKNGQIPAPQFNQWLQMYNFIKNCESNIEVDEKTGEVIE